LDPHRNQTGFGKAIALINVIGIPGDAVVSINGIPTEWKSFKTYSFDRTTKRSPEKNPCFGIKIS